jgi:hypothetical protein
MILKIKFIFRKSINHLVSAVGGSFFFLWGGSSCITGCFLLVGQSASHLLTLVLRGYFYPEDGGGYVPPKRRFTQYLHGATSQKTAFFIIYVNSRLKDVKQYVLLMTESKPSSSSSRNTDKDTHKYSK